MQLAANLLGRSLPGPPVPIYPVPASRSSGPHSSPDTDVRGSPALAVAAMLHQHGGAVQIYDPAALDNARQAAPHLTYVKTLEEAVTRADLVCVLTAWNEFCHADPTTLAQLVADAKAIDGMNCLDPTLWQGADWTYRGIGRQRGTSPEA